MDGCLDLCYLYTVRVEAMGMTSVRLTAVDVPKSSVKTDP